MNHISLTHSDMGFMEERREKNAFLTFVAHRLLNNQNLLSQNIVPFIIIGKQNFTGVFSAWLFYYLEYKGLWIGELCFSVMLDKFRNLGLWQRRIARVHTCKVRLLLRALARDKRELHPPTNYLNQAGQKQRFRALNVKKSWVSLHLDIICSFDKWKPFKRAL